MDVWECSSNLDQLKRIKVQSIAIPEIFSFVGINSGTATFREQDTSFLKQAFLSFGVTE